MKLPAWRKRCAARCAWRKSSASRSDSGVSSPAG
jgi:hypothetical protein